MSSLNSLERMTIEKLFGMSTGYVLDFSNRTFQEFIQEVVGVDIYDDGYSISGESKANRLRTFWNIENDFVRWRRIVMISILAAIPISLLELYLSATKIFPLSMITIAMSIALMVLIMVETVTLTGVKVESEYKLGSAFGRDFKFNPSIKSIVFLLGVLVLAILGLVLGFAGIYSWFYRSSQQNFTRSLDPITSVYLSVVTFATVGYGDIVPASNLLRLIATIQIAFSWMSIALLFSVTIPWIISNHQGRLNDLIQQDRNRMQRTEDIIKEASLGIYGDYGALVEEAKSRVANKKNESSQ